MGSRRFEANPQKKDRGSICARYRAHINDVKKEHQDLIQRYQRHLITIEAQERTIRDTQARIDRLPNLSISPPDRNRSSRRGRVTDLLGAIAEATVVDKTHALQSRLQNQKNGLVRLKRQLEDIGKSRDKKFEFMRHIQQQAARDGCDIDMRL